MKKITASLPLLRGIGLFAFIFGLLGQLIGQYQAFTILKQTNASPSLLAEGFRVSVSNTIYGICLFIVAYFFSFLITRIKNKKVSR